MKYFGLNLECSARALRLGAQLLVLGSFAACGDDANLTTDIRPADGREEDAGVRSDSGAPDDAEGEPVGSRDGAAEPSIGSDAGSNVRDDGGAEPGGEHDDSGGQPRQNRSRGCGQKNSGSGKFVKRTTRAAGVDRTYHVRVPANYDPSRAYDLVTRWHGTGGDGLSGGLDIEYASGNDAIVVGGDGIDNRWSSRESDLALFDAILAEVGSDYCVNLERVFAYGFSAGGGFTNLLSCVRAEALRGIVAVAGYTTFSNSECKGEVSALYFHDTNDDAVPIARGISARDRQLAANGCGTDTRDVGDGCKEYQGCDAGYPVVWCQTSGLGHNIRGDYAPGRAWEFFSGL